MAPTPEETIVGEDPRQPKTKPVSRPMSGEEVVISGMSGIFPSSDSVQAFRDNLFNKVDMVSAVDKRWSYDHPELPKHLGKITGMAKFDAQFFRVHNKQASSMDSMSRKLLEHTYSAIYDSGINPEKLRGKKVGVFIGATCSESENIVMYQTNHRHGFGITGCNKSMFANRISYWIDGKGPSYALDCSCASSTACLEHAYRSISSGQCEAAIVGGCSLCMHPCASLNLKRLGLLCNDGKTKCFDKKGDGYVRSDSVSVLFLQKAKDAHRIYSEVYHAKGNYKLKPGSEFLPKRTSDEIREFLEEFYSEIDVLPSEVEYIEAYGSGLADADGNELEGIGQVFGKEKPIKVGSVKSNMGNSEPASGVCALTKVCLGFEKGAIPANLHFEEAQDKPSIRDGRVEVVQDLTPFNRKYAGLNAFALTGANFHVLLKGHYKPKDLDRYKSEIPHLVVVSGRQESCVNKLLKMLVDHPVDPEEVALLHNIHAKEIPGHTSRGYTILSNDEENKTVVHSQHVDYYDGSPLPIWFVYSGMGSQWPGMGIELMKIPIFAEAITKCHRILEPKGVDLIDILTNTDKTIYDNILHSFVGIAAVQIGLTDVLRDMGIVPDNIIGHSVGELGCAYADGCFTAEEMILSAYSRGLVSVETQFIKGSMAAVGLGYKTALPMCPPDIEIACHNSSESCTISGPAESMKSFVADLTKKGIFAKEVPCSNIAYHSRYIASAGPKLRQYLSEVIINPKPRSKKWLSTSVPVDKWEAPAAKYSSAEYHTNNLLNSVLFEETARMIPEKAVMIEIAPHGLLQAILKRSHPKCNHVPLTRRAHNNPVKFVLEAIGRLYEHGLNPDVSVLYPRVEFPVSTGTPLLSHYVEWEHSENWLTAKFNSKDRLSSASRQFTMSVHDDDYKFIEGHVRNGENVFPESAILVLIWETFAMIKGVLFENLSVTFHDVKFFGDVTVKKESKLTFGIAINKGNNNFEINYEGTILARGRIEEGSVKSSNIVENDEKEVEEVTLTSKDVYKMLQLRGYSYNGAFQSIHSIASNQNKAQIKWTNDWVTFIDSLIQFNAFAKDYEGVSVPSIIKTLSINIEEHDKERNVILNQEVPTYDAIISNVFNVSKCGGVEIKGLVFEDKAVTEIKPDVLTNKEFIPHLLTGEVSVEMAINVNLQIIQENVAGNTIKILEFQDKSSPVLSNIVNDVAEKILDINIEMQSFDSSAYTNAQINNLNIKDFDVFIVHNVVDSEKKLMNFIKVLPINAFALMIENSTTKIDMKLNNFNVVSAMRTRNNVVRLIKKTVDTEDENMIYVPVPHDVKFTWVPWVMGELHKTRRVVLVSDRQPYCGLLGFVKSLRKQYGNKLSLILVDDFCAPGFNPEKDLFKNQVRKNLAINVLKKGMWGGFYDIPCSMSTKVRHVSLTNSVPGDFDSLTWIETPANPSSNTLVQVCYAGPTLRDVKKAAGTIEIDSKFFGSDFSGIDSNGERVMGLVQSGALSSSVQADPDLLWPVPEHWTLEEAATVIQPYAMAYYLLTSRSSIKDGSSIFIHGGAGALGQAIISISLGAGYKVCTTVSDSKKKKFLMKLFPQLKENQIGNSRDETFVQMVLKNTNRARCDFVINCATGNLREVTVKCLGLCGCFLDLSEADFMENNQFGMNCLTNERNYYAVNFNSIFKPQYAHEKKFLQQFITEGIAKGIVRPISRVVYPTTDVRKAFRLLSSSRHLGRVIIKMRDPVTLNQGVDVLPKMTYSPKASYLVVCDESTVGVELADRLVRGGATNLAVHIQSNSIDGYLCSKITSWRQKGVNARVSSENLQTEKGCANLLWDVTKMGSIQGIFIAQVEGKSRQNVSQDDFLATFNRTALVVANLDLASRNVCEDLEYFVVMNQKSDDSAVMFANSLSERICRERVEIGFPALNFQPTLLEEFAKNVVESNTKLKVQPLTTALNALEASLKLKYHNVSSFNVKRTNPSGFLDKVSNIIGITSLDDVPQDMALAKMRLSSVNLEELRTAVHEITGVQYLRSKIEMMTVADLVQISSNQKDRATSFDSRLGAFFTYIDEDECQATEPLLALRTRLTNGTENEDEMDVDATYLMLMPGFEGHHHVFVPICERLKILAVTCQLGPDVVDDNIKDMAVGIMKIMKQRFTLKSKFYLLGHSFGVNVALELAALMEKEGHVGIVFCLDSSPDALRVQLNAYLGNLTDNELQDEIIKHMYQLMKGQNCQEFEEVLKNTKSWEDKLEACTVRLRTLMHYSHQYKKAIIEAAYNRIKLAQNYKPTLKLESEIILLRGIQHPKAASLPEDYNLSQYTKQPVKVFQLSTDHAMATQDCRVSNIVNKFLEPHLLEEFKTKNLCDTYLTDNFKMT